MRLQSLRLFHFRNQPDRVLEVDAPRVLLHGPNGRGKTNLIEAIDFLATGRSFRTHKPAEMHRGSEPEMSVGGRLLRADGSGLELSVHSTARGRRPFIDGQPAVSWADYASRAAVLTFTPWDGWVLRGGAAERRAFLDRAAHLWDPDHWPRMIRFNAVLDQRNALLKQVAAGRESAEVLSGWDGPYARAAMEVIEARRRFIAILAPRWLERHSRLAGPQPGLGLAYASEAPIDAPGAPPAVERFRRRLEGLRPLDLAQGATGWGPHRDDLRFLLDGQPMRRRASQGQIRTALLAFRLAQADGIAERRGEWPLLLLDDVFGELDPERAEALMAALRELPMQTFLTSTQAHPAALDDAGLLRIAV